MILGLVGVTITIIIIFITRSRHLWELFPQSRKKKIVMAVLSPGLFLISVGKETNLFSGALPLSWRRS